MNRGDGAATRTMKATLKRPAVAVVAMTTKTSRDRAGAPGTMTTITTTSNSAAVE